MPCMSSLSSVVFWEVMGSIPVVDSDFFFVPRSSRALYIIVMWSQGSDLSVILRWPAAISGNGGDLF